MIATSLTIGEWGTFLTAEAGAAATLTGLVFVAVSINLPKIISFPGLPGRAVEAIRQLFGALIVSMMGLIPGQPIRAFGLELLGIGTILWASQLTVQIRSLRANPDHPRSWYVSRIVLSQFATLPFCVAGLSILIGFPGGLYWIVPGFIFSLLAGLSSAWVLLVEILR